MSTNPDFESKHKRRLNGEFDNKPDASTQPMPGELGVEEPAQESPGLTRIREKIAELPFFTSHYLEPDEDLSDMPESAQAILSDDWEGCTKLYDAYDDARYMGAKVQLDELLEDLQREDDDIYETFSSEDEDEAIWALQDRDDFNPVLELIRKSQPMLLRHSIASSDWLKDLPAGAAYDIGQSDTELNEPRRQVLTKALDQAGFDVDSDAAREAINELVENGPATWHDGVRLDIIWNSKPGEVELYSSPGGARSVRIASPSVLLIDQINGSGHDVTIPTKDPSGLSVTMTKENPARVDAIDHASWGEIAGVIPSAYASEVTQVENG